MNLDVSTRWRFASLLVAAAALLWLAREVNAFFIDVPFWDEWLLLPLIHQWSRGTLTLDALLAPHNEHIPFFPRLILLAIAVPSGWNVWYEVVGNLALGVATLVALVLLVRRGPARDAARRHVLYAACAVVILSLNQWENWMWGWQLEVFLNAAAVAWALVLLTGPPRGRSLLLASACGLVATFSFGNGLLFWPATLPLVWTAWRYRPAGIAWWCCAGVAASWIYVSRLDLGAVATAGARARDVGQAADVALRMLGAALTGRLAAPVAAAVGLLGLGLAVVAVARRLRQPTVRPDTLAWTALLAYGAGTALLVALGRTIPAHEAIPPRYLAFANLFWLALVVLSDRRRWQQVATAGAIVLATTVTAVQARALYVERKASLVSGRSALFSPVDNPLVSRFFWDRQVVLDLLPALRDLQLSLYDCRRQLSRPDWQAAADVIARRARPGDVIVTTNAWGASCLDAHLAGRQPGVRIVSAEDTLAAVLEALKGRATAFTISGGDVRGTDARNWIERHGYPIFRSPVGSLRLFYYPDRAAYVSDRLTAQEVADDAAALAGAPDLVARTDDRFLLHGWAHDASDAAGRYRTLLDRLGRIYVPVARRAPGRLRVRGATTAALDSLPADNAMVVKVNGVTFGEYPFPHTGRAFDFDLDIAAASWRHGGNVLSLELRHTPEGPLNRDDFPLLTVRSLLIE